MTGFRLNTAGSSIDRSQPLSFRYEGQLYRGLQGDTLASALIANGVMVTGRSFKYHRPRGIVAAGAAETNALMQLETGGLATPNVPATMIALYEGLQAQPVNCWPSARFDIGAINRLLAPVLSAGFYYKTFKWPSWSWYEGFIRRAAGLGKAPEAADPQRYGVQHYHASTLYIGRSALPCPGDPLSAQDGDLLIDPTGLCASEDCQILARTQAVAVLDHGLVLAVQDCTMEPIAGALRQRLCIIRAQNIIFAAERQEQPLVFAGNDLPGIMLASAVEELVTRFAAAPGRRILLAAPQDIADRCAALLRANGLIIAAQLHVDQGDALIRAHGRGRVRSATIRRSDGKMERITCDCIAMSGGFAPSAQLFLQAGGSLVRDAQTGALIASDANAKVQLAAPLIGTPPVPVPPEIRASAKLAAKSFVDFQTDVTLADIAQAVDENYTAPDHLKRYTVLGMGVDQGRLSGMNAAALLAQLSGRDPAVTLPTKARPPALPTAFATLSAGRPAGELMRPRKILPAAAFHAAHGAVFEDYGWQRPSHYPIGPETLFESAQREALAVRRSAGLFDASPIGKIELRGNEAAEFLDHIYVGKMSSLKVGKARYGLMLNELGTLFDDGVVMRLASDHFLLNTTSGHAERVFDWLEYYRQCHWKYDVVIQNVTTHWATFSVAGPAARAVLGQCASSFDFDDRGFAHMSIRCGQFAGVSARLAMVSFSGEAGFEICVPASDAERAIGEIWRCGKPLKLVPYGVEALEILRIEKGFIHIGSDTDAETQPGDIGFGGMGHAKPADFIGRRSLMRASSADPTRKQLVGLVADNPAAILPMGAHVLGDQRRSIGWIGSACLSPTLGHGVALAMIEAGQTKVGQQVQVYSLGQEWTASICQKTFIDPGNERIHA